MTGIPDYGDARPCFLPESALAESDSPYRPEFQSGNADAPPTGRTGCTICPLPHSYSMSKWIPMRSITRRSDGRRG